MKLHSIETGYFKLDGGAMFGVVPKTIWNKLNPSDENNLCNWAMRSLLIEEGNRLILIDNGMGDKQDAKFMSYYNLHGEYTLDSSLKKIGLSKDDITDVILTHLHFDHCGGSIIRKGEFLVPNFKNALYWSNENHWEWATKPNDREKASFLKENILPIQESGQLNFIPLQEGIRFSDHISIRFVHGHTEAMMLPQIQLPENQTVVFMADLLPSRYHIPMPYIMAYDMFPLKTLHEKRAFLDEAIQKKHVLFFQHDPEIECGTVKMTEKGVRLADQFALHDFC